MKILGSLLVGAMVGACGGGSSPTPASEAVAVADVTALGDAIAKGDTAGVETKSLLDLAPMDPVNVPYVPAGEGCPGFPIKAIGSGGKSIVKEYSDENGVNHKLEVGKGHALTLVRLEGPPEDPPNTPAPAVVNELTLPSNWFVTYTATNPDTSQKVTAIGSNVIVLFPTDNPPGPSTTLHEGKLVYAISPEFVWTILDEETKTKQTDICAALANLNPR